MSSVYIYVVDRDFGFAPNPYHGVCTLATCKPKIRQTAKVNDWIFGVGGRRLKATGNCLFSMKVTSKMTFNEYWSADEFQDKKPVRNGSKKMMAGDNIYFLNPTDDTWEQAHSHHSNKDGSVNMHNLKRDTKSEFVLLSNHFYYFGRSAPEIPESILQNIGYKNQRNYRKFTSSVAQGLVLWIEEIYSSQLNLVIDDPYDFANSEAHYSAETNKVT
jgi:hypothetical protein